VPDELAVPASTLGPPEKPPGAYYQSLGKTKSVLLEVHYETNYSGFIVVLQLGFH
jgi:hypothetical protein